MVITRGSKGVRASLRILLLLAFCSTVGLLVLAVDNETNPLSGSLDVASLPEDAAPAEASVLPEESGETAVETAVLAVPTPAELVEEALGDYEDKVTVRTAEVLSDAEPTDTVRILVRYRGASAGDADLSRVDVSVTEMTVAEAAALLENGDVEALEVDQPVDLFADMVPWGVNRTRAPGVWNETTGSGIAVGIVDTGIASHVDLDIVGGTSVVGGSYVDTHGHGTAVAGVVAAIDDGSGLVGVAPDVDLYAIKVMNGSSGQLSDVVAGIDWAIANDMNVLVMSFGTEDYSQILEDALDDAADAGMLLIAAAGNDGGDVRYPAAYDDVIAVGSVDAAGAIAVSSNTGPELELVAPGVDVNTTDLNGYTVLDGTSLAAPHIAGVAALVWAHNTSLSATQVRNVLRSTAEDLGDSGRDDTYGFGLVQAVLNTGNSTPVNDSYFYEVWNIIEYGTENETLTFWTNGTGTYEDLNFTPGYYLLQLYLASSVVNRTLEVNETGAFHLLIRSPGILFLDDYIQEGSSTDGRLWESGSLSFKYDEDGNQGNADMVCFDYSQPGSFSADFCYAANASALASCKSRHSVLNTFCGPSDTNCATSGLTNYHALPGANLNSVGQRFLGLQAYYACSASSIIGSEDREYYVFDQKRTECASDPAQYSVAGRFETGPDDYKDIDDIACTSGYICDSNLAGDVITADPDYDFTFDDNPCVVNSTTDLVITGIVPIQVVKDADLVVGKTTLVRTYVLNNGSEIVHARVMLTVGTDLVNAGVSYNSSVKYLLVNQTRYFDIKFKPTKVAANGNITVEVFPYG